MTCIDPERLRKAMDRAGVPVVLLANQCGVTTSYMTKIVNGTARLKRNPALRRQIATALDVPLDWITVAADRSAA